MQFIENNHTCKKKECVKNCILMGSKKKRNPKFLKKYPKTIF